MLAPWAVADPGGRARLAPALAAALAVVFLLERLAAWHLPGEQGELAIAGLGALLRLHTDEHLWRPWQPWSAALFAHGWAGLALAQWTLLVPGAALERAHGPAALALLTTLLAALGAAPFLALGSGPLDGPGSDPLLLGLAAAAAAGLPGVRLRWGVAWYALVAVGWRELAATTMAGGLAACAVLAVLHALMTQLPPVPALSALALCAGCGLLGGRLLSIRR
jgi:hypothetical protein